MNIFCSSKSPRRLSGGARGQRLFDGKNRRREYFLLYTALFALVCCVVFCWYFFTGRTFIWRADGWSQHYKSLVYYAGYMRNIIRELLFNHRFVFPEWEFGFGEGNDILHSLHYYVIGDPFSVFSIFVPSRFLWIYYDFMILLRLYLAGVAFSYLCFYTKKNIGRYAVMAGALSYVFCYWTIYNAARHPYFLNPMLYFPLIVLGVEKILRKEKPYVLIVSVFLASISNFYYFYVIALVTAIYVAVRLIVKYKTDIKSMLIALLKIAGSSVLATVMGSIILVPVVIAFLSDARMGAGNAWHIVYPLSYYSKLPGSFFFSDSSYWLCMGYAAPVALAIFLLFIRKKQHRLLKVCFLISLVIILFPFLGQILNGMSYMSNKWCWALALLCAYTFALMWSELMSLNKQTALKLACFLGVCFAVLLVFECSRTIAAFACVGFAFLFLIAIFPFESESRKAVLLEKHKQVVALVLVIAAIANISYFKNASDISSYADEAKEIADVVEKFSLTEANAVKSAAKSDGVKDFYRYSGRDLTDNAGVLKNLSATNYFWSISNPSISEYRHTMESREPLPQDYQGYDDRTSLITLSSVRYYVVPSTDKAPIPYGFTYVKSYNVKKKITKEALRTLRDELGVEQLSKDQIRVIKDATASKYKIYRNDNALPLSYTYDKVISEDKWDKLSAVEKQEAMLQSAMIFDYDGKTQDDEINFSSKPLDYSVKCNGNGVTLEDYGFVVTKADASVTINFDGVENSETYFSIKGLDFEGAYTYELYFGDEKFDPMNLFSQTRWNLLPYKERKELKNNYLFCTDPTQINVQMKSSTKVSKQLDYYTNDYSWYNDTHDFTINFDYNEEAVTSIKLTFPNIGIYSFDSIDIICQPMDDYSEQVQSLKEDTLQNVKIGTDTISGNISLDEPKILCLSVPYSTGWTAYVDGEEATLYQANIKNMALALDKGEHTVKLEYHTPYLKLGAVLSVAGFVGFAALLLFGYLRKRKLSEGKRRYSR
ncbi:MAG: YfhO family protein [Ruminococcus sp.]|nr:YfhO family protein [Ruminococcus sp.]